MKKGRGVLHYRSQSSKKKFTFYKIFTKFFSKNLKNTLKTFFLKIIIRFHFAPSYLT